MPTPLDEIDRREPIIASSNRAADVEPYAKSLFAEDPKKWMQILPWEFPYGEREAEEQFLREFFTDREIRKQGGANLPGNGYRFLKQVWIWAAMWNVNQRIPMITWDWIEKNQDIYTDPLMLPHLLNDEVKPSTFFTPEEFGMYSEKVLVYAVKGIQACVRQRENDLAAQATESGQETAAGADATCVPVEQDTTEQPDATSTTPVPPSLSPADQPVEAKTDAAVATTAPSEQPAAATVDESNATTEADEPVPVAVAPADTADPAIDQVTSAQSQGNQTRNFSSGSNVVEERQPSWRRGRGNQGKRNSFNQPRPPPRGPPTFGDPRHVSNPYPSPYGGPPAQMSPIPPGSAPVTHRFPSGSYPCQMAPMPTLPQGQQLYGPPPTPGHQAPMPQPYGSQMPLQHMYLNTMSPAAGSYQYGPAPDAYMQAQPTPFADRSNVHPNTRQFSNEQPYYSMGDQADYRYGRRDSVQSRGVKGRAGYAGSVRGKGNRGRGSLSNEGQFMARTGPNETNTGPFQQHQGTFSTEREGEWQNQHWQARGPGGSPFAHGSNCNAPEYGPTRYQQRPYQGNAPATSGPNDPRPGPGPHPVYNRNVQRCTAGCTKFAIGENCRTATKLIVFNVAPSFDMDESFHFFSQFGVVRDISDPRQPNKSDGKPHRWYIFVTFEDVSAARNCLANRGVQWPGGSLLPEIALEHVTPDHYHPASSYHGSSNASGAPTASTMPAQELPEAPPQQQMTKRQAPSTQREPQSGYSTPVATDSSTTPTPSQGGTPKNKKGPKKYTKKKRAEKQEDIANEKASEYEQGQNDAAQSTTEEPTTGPSTSTEAEAANEPEPRKAAGHDAPPVGEDAEVKATKDTVPQTGGDEDSTPTVASAERVVVSENQESAPIEQGEVTGIGGEPAGSTKHDDDLNDESFHTASGSPELEKEPALEEGDVATTPTPPQQEGTQEQSASASVSDVGSAHSNDSVLSKSSLKSPSSREDSKKTPIPQVSSQKSVTIAVPPIASGKAQSESLQVLQQRSTSGSSEPKTPAFVTAPSTPAIQEPSQEPRSKKTPKQKGPEQTESLSIFSKPKRKASKANNKKSAGKRKSSALEPVDDAETASQSRETMDTPDELETSGTKQEKSTVQSPGSQHEEIIADPAAMPSTTAEKSMVAEMQGSDDSMHGMSSKAAAKRPLGRSATMAPTHDDTATPSPQTVASEKQEQEEEEVEQEEGVVGLGISSGQTPVDAKTKKKGKNKRGSKKKKPGSTADVTEMSHPGVDSHTSKSTYEFKANDLGVATQEPKPMAANATANANAAEPKDHRNLTSSSNANKTGSTRDVGSPGKKVPIQGDNTSDDETPNVRQHLRLPEAEDISDLFDRSVAAKAPQAGGSASTPVDTKASPEDVEIIYVVWADDDKDPQATSKTVKPVKAKQQPQQEEAENETVRSSKETMARLFEQEQRLKKSKGKQTETQD